MVDRVFYLIIMVRWVLNGVGYRGILMIIVTKTKNIKEQQINQNEVVVKIASISHQLGQWGEQQTAFELKQAGFDIIEQNFYSRYGEIDIIAIKQQELLFVEVKARAKTQRGTAVEAVTWTKQQKMIKTILYFLEKNPQFHEFYLRFDIFCFDFHQVFAKNVQYDFSKYTYDLQWIENAFTMDTEFINL